MFRRGYTELDVRLDAAFPSGFAPEEHMPPEIRRAERLREREFGFALAEAMLRHGARVETVAQLIAVPRQERTEARRWAVRVEEARLCGDVSVCAMPVRGCPDHGDTLEWRKGGWRCRVPKCRGFQYEKQQRRHCNQSAVALIDYPSGHRRWVCAGHLASERAVWANAPEDATIRVTLRLTAVEAAGAGR